MTLAKCNIAQRNAAFNYLAANIALQGCMYGQPHCSGLPNPMIFTALINLWGYLLHMWYCELVLRRSLTGNKPVTDIYITKIIQR